jgi:hypothetical protein
MANQLLKKQREKRKSSLLYGYRCTSKSVLLYDGRSKSLNNETQHIDNSNKETRTIFSN